jgi:subtilisin family serine protease
MLQRFYRVEADRADANEIAKTLRGMPGVSSAFIKPKPLLPIAPDQPAFAMNGSEGRPIPDFTPQQGYRSAAPDGVDVAAAWALPGGRGEGISIIDIEGGWCLDHVDLEGNGGLRGGVDFPEIEWRNHGTAVLGVMVGEDDPRGVRGLAPAARAIAYTHRTDGAAGAIQRAADLLSPGDVLLLEMHSPGPRYDYEERDDQLGYIAVEWWPDTLLAVRYAISRGIVVVGAAGNGAENLDDELYDVPVEGFPEDWANPFRRTDSGAIIVGAGAPPGGAFGPARSRLDFSNYGSRVDCQGWGRGVCTTGYGDLWAGNNESEWFTAEFSGTSSASPIVAGAVASLQGIARARQGPLTPDTMRQLFRDNGSVQANPGAAAERIGCLPDLARLVAAI